MGGQPGSYDPAEASHRALRSIRQELERHPVVSEVRGFPDEEFTEVIGELEPERWGIDRHSATLTARWFAGSDPGARPEFSFHYSDDEVDFGWHHHEQEHVDGWGHVQKRTGESEYTYESQTFPSHNPARLVWEIMALLSSKLEAG